MIKKIVIFTLFFYLLVLLQTSFFPHFFKIFPNLILISIVFINFFEKIKNFSGIYFAFLGGFFLDIFSERFFGFWILISLILAIFIKFFIKKYIQT